MEKENGRVHYEENKKSARHEKANAPNDADENAGLLRALQGGAPYLELGNLVQNRDQLLRDKNSLPVEYVYLQVRNLSMHQQQ